jgi:O-succinylbenzoate synthase
MLTLERVVLREIRLSLREPFRISSGTVHERRILLLETRTHDGTSVWSECVAGEHPHYSAETIDTAWLALTQWIVPRVLGRSFAQPRAVHEMLEHDVRGHRMAKAALEMSLWAIVAEQRQTSLARLLGATRERIEIGVSLGIQASAERLVAKAAESMRAGYHKIKLKIEPGSDVEFVRAVRAALPAAPLMVDANNAYTLDDADALERLDEFGLIMIEQPLEHEDLVRHAQLQARLLTPICLDESITSVQRAQDMITLGAGRIINIKPGRVGGFTPSLDIHDLCVSHRIPVWCGGMLESGIGRAYNVALAALPGFTIAGDISPSARYWEQDIVTPEWTMSAPGIMTVPLDVRGIGVSVDEDRVDDLTVRSVVLETKRRGV